MKVALVTGGNTGIGVAVAENTFMTGADVVVDGGSLVKSH